MKKSCPLICYNLLIIANNFSWYNTFILFFFSCQKKWPDAQRIKPAHWRLLSAKPLFFIFIFLVNIWPIFTQTKPAKISFVASKYLKRLSGRQSRVNSGPSPSFLGRLWIHSNPDQKKKMLLKINETVTCGEQMNK